MKRLALEIFRASGLSGLARRVLASRGRFVLEFHGVPRDRGAGLPAPLRPCLSRDDLDGILNWLGSRFRFLSPAEFFAADAPGVLLTFDDGFANQAREALPLLEAHDAHAIVFVTTRHVVEPRHWLPFVESALQMHGRGTASEATLHEIFDGMSQVELERCAESAWITIGSHTVDHPLLSRCEPARLRRELEESKRCLEALTGQEVDLLAYPSGDYDARVVKAAKQAGYRAAFVEDSRSLGVGAFEIPRVGLYSAEEAYLAAKLSGLHRRPLSVRWNSRQRRSAG